MPNALVASLLRSKTANFSRDVTLWRLPVMFPYGITNMMPSAWWLFRDATA